jgi:hypothetical protein
VKIIVGLLIGGAIGFAQAPQFVQWTNNIAPSLLSQRSTTIA